MKHGSAVINWIWYGCLFREYNFGSLVEKGPVARVITKWCTAPRTERFHLQFSVTRVKKSFNYASFGKTSCHIQKNNYMWIIIWMWKMCTPPKSNIHINVSFFCATRSMNLTWRDMQHLVVRTSRPAHLITNDWRTNGVGRLGNWRPITDGMTAFLCLVDTFDLMPLSLCGSEPFLRLWSAGCQRHGHIGPKLEQRGAAAQMCH